MEKSYVLIIVLLLMSVGRVAGAANAIFIQAPEILIISRSPLEPPPGYPVNATALVRSPRPIEEVILQYSSLPSINGTVKMVFVEGNETFALYFATLPASEDGATVNYKVVAFDSSGFRGEGGNASYSHTRKSRHIWCVGATRLDDESAMVNWSLRLGHIVVSLLRRDRATLA